MLAQKNRQDNAGSVRVIGDDSLATAKSRVTQNNPTTLIPSNGLRYYDGKSNLNDSRIRESRVVSRLLGKFRLACGRVGQRAEIPGSLSSPNFEYFPQIDVQPDKQC